MSFHVELGPSHSTVFATVARCPEGEAKSSFVIPFAADLKELRPHLGRCVRSAVPLPGRWRHPARAEQSVRKVGTQLFLALIHDDVERLYRESLERDPHQALVLHLDPAISDFHLVANLPWEILRDPKRNRWISLVSPVVRCLHVATPAGKLPGPPLRILVVVSNPADRPPLRLPEEVATLAGTGPGIEVHFLANPTARELADQVRSQSFNALHFMGHGELDPETGEGSLVLCSAAGGSHPVSADWLAHLLYGEGFRLTVLNACDTGRTCDEDGRDPFIGVASALVAAGIPAAVAMQFSISDAAALAFSRGFYQALVRGSRLGSAVMAGRHAIRSLEAESLEWGTPVLFLREREESEEGIGELAEEQPESSAPVPWGTCGLAFGLQALAWMSLIWLITRVPPYFQKGLPILDSVAVSAVLVVFIGTLAAGFFRLGSALARVSSTLAWTVSGLAILAGVSLWFWLSS